MHVVDAQVHVWGRNSPERPWIAGMEHIAWSPEYLVDELQSDMQVAGVDAAVLVPPGAFEGFRNDLVIEAVRRDPSRFAAMGQVDFRQARAGERLEQLLDEPLLHGMRLSFTVDGNRALFMEGKLDWAFQLMEKKGKPVMIYAPRLEDRILAVARRHEGLRMAICHINLDQKDRDLPLQPRLDPVLALAACPNISVKASALSLQSHAAFPFEDVHDALKRVIDAFGVHRTFWGTDISRLACTYEEAKAFFFELPFLSGAALEAVMGGALRDWLGWARR